MTGKLCLCNFHGTFYSCQMKDKVHALCYFLAKLKARKVAIDMFCLIIDVYSIQGHNSYKCACVAQNTHYLSSYQASATCNQDIRPHKTFEDIFRYHSINPNSRFTAIILLQFSRSSYSIYGG